MALNCLENICKHFGTENIHNSGKQHMLISMKTIKNVCVRKFLNAVLPNSKKQFPNAFVNREFECLTNRAVHAVNFLPERVQKKVRKLNYTLVNELTDMGYNVPHLCTWAEQRAVVTNVYNHEVEPTEVDQEKRKLT